METKNGFRFGLTLAALGVVFGDIGTSPLYALRECFGPHSLLKLNNENIFGVLSLIIWSLIIVIFIKYLFLVMNAHNKGEGGVLALTALIHRKLCKKGLHSRFIGLSISLGIFGAALLYADGVITPAISVLSAIEGLSLISKEFENWVIPLTIFIIALLFSLQKYGTGSIGKFFGPIILIWFATLAIIGVVNILKFPSILYSFNPLYGVNLFIANPYPCFIALGSIFLVVTGAEALYADMGHFGASPIRFAWTYITFPSLVLNYMGQASLLITNPAAIENPFYRMFPEFMIVPMVILATITSGIASQAVISGAFSLTGQAVQLGYLPRLQIIRTSSEHQGQIYVPTINVLLAISSILLVASFKTSSNLAAAYGIAVCSTMLITSFLMFLIMRRIWRMNFLLTLFTITTLSIFDCLFLSANLLKFFDGGIIPLLSALIIYFIMITWKQERTKLQHVLVESGMSWEKFISQVSHHEVAIVPGTAIFLSQMDNLAPQPLVKNVKHNKVIHQNNLILTFRTLGIPVVSENRLEIQDLSNGFFRVIAKFGFREVPNIEIVLRDLKKEMPNVDLSCPTFFLGRELIKSQNLSLIATVQTRLFAVMSRNARSAAQYFNLPSDRVFEVGSQYEI